MRTRGPLLIGLLALSASAIVADEAPKAPLDALELHLEPIRAHLQNMKMRLNNDVQQIGRHVAPEPAASEFMNLCCSINLRILRREAASLEARTLWLQEVYDEAQRLDGVALAGDGRTDAANLRDQIERLASATSKDQAIQFLRNTIRALHNVHRTEKAIEDCCNDVKLPPLPPLEGAEATD